MREDGKVSYADITTTLDAARARADRLKAALEGRSVHSEVLNYCRAELLDENYSVKESWSPPGSNWFYKYSASALVRLEGLGNQRSQTRLISRTSYQLGYVRSRIGTNSRSSGPM